MQRRPYQKDQLGWTAMSLVGFLILLGIVLSLSMRLGPHYIDYRTIRAVGESLQGEKIHEMDKRSIRDLINKRFRINSVYELKAHDIFDIERTKKSTQIVLKYEVREPLVANVDAVLKFHDEFDFK